MEISDAAWIDDHWDHFWASLGKIEAASWRNGRRGWVTVSHSLGGRLCGRCGRLVATREDVRRYVVSGKCDIVAAWIERNRKKGRKELAMERAAAKFEASGALVIPEKPTEIITTGFAERTRNALQTITDLEIIEEGHRRLLALEWYLTDKTRRNEVRAAARWCEVRIGELLGPTTKGERTDLKPSLASESLSKDDVYRFRLLAANRGVVEQCIRDRKNSRSAILARIDAHANGNGKKLDTEAVARKAIALLKRELEHASAQEKMAVATAILDALGITDQMTGGAVKFVKVCDDVAEEVAANDSPLRKISGRQNNGCAPTLP